MVGEDEDEEDQEITRDRKVIKPPHHLSGSPYIEAIHAIDIEHSIIEEMSLHLKERDVAQKDLTSILKSPPRLNNSPTAESTGKNNLTFSTISKKRMTLRQPFAILPAQPAPFESMFKRLNLLRLTRKFIDELRRNSRMLLLKKLH